MKRVEARRLVVAAALAAAFAPSAAALLVVALLVLLCIPLASNLYFEAALLIAMMGFVGTAALSKFLTRGDIIE